MGCSASKQEDDRDCVGAAIARARDGLEAAEEVRYEIMEDIPPDIATTKNILFSIKLPNSSLWWCSSCLCVFGTFSAKQSHICCV